MDGLEIENLQAYRHDNGVLWHSAELLFEQRRYGAVSFWGSWEIYEIVSRDEQLTIDPIDIDHPRRLRQFLLAKPAISLTRYISKHDPQPE